MSKLNKIQKYCQTRVMRCLYFLKISNRYSPYCPYCSGCGETGCCAPTSCINHPKGHYCETNNDALKVSYWTLNEFWNQLDEKKYPEVENLLSDIYSKNYGEQREYRMSLPEKLTLKEKIKKWYYSAQ